MQGHRLTPPPAAPEPTAAESLDALGLRDSAFTVLPSGNVQLTGSRYELSGVELPYLLPWIRRVMAIELPVADTHESHYPPEVPPSRANLPFQSEIRSEEHTSELQSPGNLVCRLLPEKTK